MIFEKKMHSLCFIVGIVFIAFAMLLSTMDNMLFSLISYFVSYFIVCYGCVKENNQFFSLSIVFWTFSMIYGVVIPINIALGIPFNSVFSISSFQFIDVFLRAFYLSCFAFCLGKIFSSMKNSHSNISNLNYVCYINEINSGLFISALLASLFEMVNLMRIGGFSLIFYGKGVYQSLVGNLSLTLPSNSMYVAFGVFLGLAIALDKEKMHPLNKKAVVFSTFFLLPFFIIKVMLGMRGVLISSLLAGLASYSFVSPVRKISFKLVVASVIICLFFSFLYLNRGIVPLIVDNPKKFNEMLFDSSRYEGESNPAEGEFSVSAGNFCTYIERYGTSFEPYMGKTYVDALATMVPGFLYPGTKPIQITYTFRDEFFSSMSQLSAVGSTGFSSILEAFMNWKWFGVFFVYFIIASVLSFFDLTRLTTKSIYVLFLYSSLISPCMSFSRNAMGGFIGGIFINFVVITFVFTVSQKIFVFNNNVDLYAESKK